MKANPAVDCGANPKVSRETQNRTKRRDHSQAPLQEQQPQGVLPPSLITKSTPHLRAYTNQVTYATR